MSIWAATVWLKNRLENFIVENGEKWFYSGKTGTEKTLINKEEWLEEELRLPAETSRNDNEGYIVGFFVPKVSGLHTITVTADTLNANEEAMLTFVTFNELLHAITNYNLIEATKIENLDFLYKYFYPTVGSYTTFGIPMARKLISDYMYSKKCASDETFSIKRYCTKDEPVFLIAVNDEATDIDLWSAVVTVKYRETEPYE